MKREKGKRNRKKTYTKHKIQSSKTSAQINSYFYSCLLGTFTPFGLIFVTYHDRITGQWFSDKCICDQRSSYPKSTVSYSITKAELIHSTWYGTT